MRAKILWGLAGAGWFVLCLMVSFWLTFPSQTLIDRARFEVQNASDGAMALNIASLSPRWMGVAAGDVEIVSVSGDGEGSTLLRADGITAHAGLWSLITGAPNFSGYATFGEGTLSYSGSVSSNEEGQLGLRRIGIEASEFPLSAIGALLAPLLGDGFEGTGFVDLSVELVVPEGIGSARGKISIAGKDLVVTVSVPDPFGGDEPFPIGPVSIADLDMVLSVQDGRAEVTRGKMQSDFLTLGLDGKILLNDVPMRSRLQLEAHLSDLGGDLASFESLLSRAKGDDEKYHYSIACTLDRLNARCFKPKRSRGPRASRQRKPLEELSPEERAEKDRMADERAKRREERRRDGGGNGALPPPIRDGRVPRRPRERAPADLGLDRADDGPQADDERFDDEVDDQVDEVISVPEDGMPEPVPLDDMGDENDEGDFVD
jgi:type II secretion system protein N